MVRIESEVTTTNYCYDNKALSVINVEHVSTISERIQILRRIFNSGKSRPLKFRRQQLQNLKRCLQESSKDLLMALGADLGKHPQEAYVTEIDLVLNDLEHTLQDLDNWSRPENVDKRFINLLDKVQIYRDPYGVVLIIGPWNYPVLLTCGPLIGALAAGNCVLLKPSELSPNVSKLLMEILPNYLDPEVFQVVLGGVPETTELLQERFDYIFFTGSTQVGRIVHQAAAKFLTPVTLELGGKSPVYIHDSANIELATKRILWGKWLNAGQTCIAPDYILCSAQTQVKFVERARFILQEFLKNGDEDLGRIISEQHFKRLINFLNGADIALGGEYNEKLRLIRPTILQNVSPNETIMQEEIFGPLLPIINVNAPEEAVNFINSREKPLALYVFTKDAKIGKYFLQNTSSGGVTINDTIMHITTENLPFGGVGSSGMGAYHGRYGYETFCHRKAVLQRNLNMVSELFVQCRYPPYTDFKLKFLRSALKKRQGLSLEVLYKIGWCIFGFLLGYIFFNLYT